MRYLTLMAVPMLFAMASVDAQTAVPATAFHKGRTPAARTSAPAGAGNGKRDLIVVEGKGLGRKVVRPKLQKVKFIEGPALGYAHTDCLDIPQLPVCH